MRKNFHGRKITRKDTTSDSIKYLRNENEYWQEKQKKNQQCQQEDRLQHQKSNSICNGATYQGIVNFERNNIESEILGSNRNNRTQTVQQMEASCGPWRWNMI